MHSRMPLRECRASLARLVEPDSKISLQRNGTSAAVLLGRNDFHLVLHHKRRPVAMTHEIEIAQQDNFARCPAE